MTQTLMYLNVLTNVTRPKKFNFVLHQINWFTNIWLLFRVTNPRRFGWNRCHIQDMRNCMQLLLLILIICRLFKKIKYKI